jgi:oligosaccharide repeat unit polymerase
LPLLNQKNYFISNQTLYKFIDKILIFIIAISIIPFYETILYLINSIINGSFFVIAEKYDAVATGEEEAAFHLSFIGKKLLIIMNWLVVANPILFYIYCQKGVDSKFIPVSFLVASYVPAFYNVALGSRTVLLYTTLYYIILYLFFRKTFNRSVEKFLLKESVLLISFVLIGLVGLTVGRFVMGEKFGGMTLYDALFQYTAESMYNFNNQMWHITQYSDGAYNFGRVLSIFGINMYNPVPNQVVGWFFYSVPGYAYADFGLFGGILYFIIIAFLMIKVFPITNTMSFSTLMMWGLYLYVLSGSLFYININGESLLTTIILIILLKILRL